jgi:RNA polymerase sigma factor (sigma-70 family)
MSNIDNAIATLAEQEAKVINLRFGLDGLEHTRREIGELLGISAGRAREIEHRALRNLRRPVVSRTLLEMLG